MQHISATPFGRRVVSAGLLAGQALAKAEAALPAIDKWQLFTDLREARAAFGVSDRDLAVLHALLGFLPARELEAGAALMAFPSNKTLSDRLHGMPESTLRRHIAALVEARLIARHDSPNGKRYATRGPRGDTLLRAFGFSLRPLLIRAPEIAAAAETARSTALHLRLSREALVLCLRDSTKLLAYAEAEGMALPDQATVTVQLAALRNLLRRKLDLAEVSRLLAAAQTLREGLTALLLPPAETAQPSGSDSHFERHSQESNTYFKESESCMEIEKPQTATPDAPPLDLVVKACPDLLPYAGGEIQSWHQFCATAQDVRPMMGIPPDAWAEALRIMGALRASVTLAAILQRIQSIRSPGAYLRHLTSKAAKGEFCPAPMIRALL